MRGNNRYADGGSSVKDNVRYYSALGPEAVSDRIRALDGEADLEGAVTAALAGLGTLGLVMGLFGARSFRLFTWAALPALLAFGLGKWFPPPALAARRGLRPRKEIEEERFALKALRGDFSQVSPPSEEADHLERKASQVLDAVKA